VLVGIITRGDLLRPYLRTDSEILAAVEDAVLAQGLSPKVIRAGASEGVVTLEGSVGTERDRSILLRLIRSLDGVIDVVDHLSLVA